MCPGAWAGVYSSHSCNMLCTPCMAARAIVLQRLQFHYCMPLHEFSCSSNTFQGHLPCHMLRYRIKHMHLSPMFQATELETVAVLVVTSRRGCRRRAISLRTTFLVVLSTSSPFGGRMECKIAHNTGRLTPDRQSERAGIALAVAVSLSTVPRIR